MSGSLYLKKVQTDGHIQCFIVQITYDLWLNVNVVGVCPDALTKNDNYNVYGNGMVKPFLWNISSSLTHYFTALNN